MCGLIMAWLELAARSHSHVWYGCRLGTLGLLPLGDLSSRTTWASLHGGLGLHKGAWNSHLPSSVSQESHKANPGSRGEEMDSTHWWEYSCLENSMDRGAWWATFHGGPKESDTTEWLMLSLSLMEGVAESRWKSMQLRGAIVSAPRSSLLWWQRRLSVL